MQDILTQLADYARVRTERAKQICPPEQMRERACALPRGNFAFERKLAKPGLSFICECKKASPSKGLIAPDFPYMEIARAYEEAGADAISVLTEPRWFQGKNDMLREIASEVQIPCLRKDFTVDSYMIYEAKCLGASAVLLICSILSETEIRAYIRICDMLGISALAEVHDEAEIRKGLRAGARIIGVNNRNLRDFSVDTENSRRLRAMVPTDVLFVSESGVRSAEDARSIRSLGADAVLVGEYLMRAADKRRALRALKDLPDEGGTSDEKTHEG